MTSGATLAIVGLTIASMPLASMKSSIFCSRSVVNAASTLMASGLSGWPSPSASPKPLARPCSYSVARELMLLYALVSVLNLLPDPAAAPALRALAKSRRFLMVGSPYCSICFS